MKKLILFFVIVLSLTGCSEDPAANDPTPYISITPNPIDTLIATNIDGSLNALYFTANTNLPIKNTVFNWFFFDSQGDTTVRFNNHISHTFLSPGIYAVLVIAFDTSGNYLASDTIGLSVRTEEISNEILANSKQIIVSFSSELLRDTLGNRLLEAGIEKGKNNNTVFSILQDQVSCFTIDTFTETNVFREHRVSFTGALSKDLTQIDSMRVYLEDTVSLPEVDRHDHNVIDITFTELTLLSITDKYITYVASFQPRETYIKNIYINSPKPIYNSFGQISINPCFYLEDSYLLHQTEYVTVFFVR